MSNESPEYRVIVQANNLAVEIDNEVMVVHKVRSAPDVDCFLGLQSYED